MKGDCGNQVYWASQNDSTWYRLECSDRGARQSGGDPSWPLLRKGALARGAGVRHKHSADNALLTAHKGLSAY